LLRNQFHPTLKAGNNLFSILSPPRPCDFKIPWGVWILATAVNTGAKFLNDTRKITLKRDGKEVTPIADIEF
jgi:hypothetical protein